MAFATSSSMTHSLKPWVSLIVGRRIVRRIHSVQITIPTEMIGSLPRTTELLEGQQAYKAGHISASHLEQLRDKAARQTLVELEKTGPGQLTDGEQAKPSFLVYP